MQIFAQMPHSINVHNHVIDYQSTYYLAAYYAKKVEVNK